jgi:hypothetical protein
MKSSAIIDIAAIVVIASLVTVDTASALNRRSTPGHGRIN